MFEIESPEEIESPKNVQFPEEIIKIILKYLCSGMRINCRGSKHIIEYCTFHDPPEYVAIEGDNITYEVERIVCEYGPKYLDMSLSNTRIFRKYGIPPLKEIIFSDCRKLFHPFSARNPCLIAPERHIITLAANNGDEFGVKVNKFEYFTVQKSGDTLVFHFNTEYFIRELFTYICDLCSMAQNYKVIVLDYFERDMIHASKSSSWYTIAQIYNLKIHGTLPDITYLAKYSSNHVKIIGPVEITYNVGELCNKTYNQCYEQPNCLNYIEEIKINCTFQTIYLHERHPGIFRHLFREMSRFYMGIKKLDMSELPPMTNNELNKCLSYFPKLEILTIGENYGSRINVEILRKLKILTINSTITKKFIRNLEFASNLEILKINNADEDHIDMFRKLTSHEFKVIINGDIVIEN